MPLEVSLKAPLKVPFWSPRQSPPFFISSLLWPQCVKVSNMNPLIMVHFILSLLHPLCIQVSKMNCLIMVHLTSSLLHPLCVWVSKMNHLILDHFILSLLNSDRLCFFSLFFNFFFFFLSLFKAFWQAWGLVPVKSYLLGLLLEPKTFCLDWMLLGQSWSNVWEDGFISFMIITEMVH